MSLRIISKGQQAYGAFNRGQIIENKPIGFPQDGGFVRPFSNLFYWARAEAVIGSTIGLHPHQGFEIMSFVLDGDIRHFDTKNDEWKPLHKGDVQIIRAGSGIQHAEHLEKGAVIFQIWVDPDLSKTLSQPATYDDYPESGFPTIEHGENVERILIGEGSPLTLDTKPFEVSRYKVLTDISIDIPEGRMLAIYNIDGSGTINGETVEKDDFVIVEDEGQVKIDADENMDVFAITVSKSLPYTTYAQARLNQ